MSLHGLHRKAAIRPLNKEPLLHGREKRGRPRKYGHEAAEILKTAWEAEDRLCSKRLHPLFRRFGENTKKEWRY